MRTFLLLFLLIVGAPTIKAEEAQRLLGLTIAEVVVEAAPGEDLAELLRLAGLVPGDPYSSLRVRRAVEILQQLGRFENVFVYARRVDNGVVLRLHLPPRPVLRELRVEESEVLSASEIELMLSLALGREISATSLGPLREKIEQALADQAYRDPAVGLALEPVDPNGGVALVVRISEGPTTVLRRVVMRGQPVLPLATVAERVGLVPQEVLDLRDVRAGLERLLDDYRRMGYWDARIEPPEVRMVRRGEAPLADLVLDIAAGPKIEVRFRGQRALPTRELLDEAASLVQSGTGPAALAEVRERILARYEKRGYWQARVEPAVRRTQDGARKQVLFSISEGSPARMGAVRFVGQGAVSTGRLEAELRGAVAQALAEELGRPGANGEVVGDLLGDQSLEHKRTNPFADTSLPDPQLVYVSRAYRAAVDAIADLYRSEGYQTVEVSPPIVRERADTGLLDVEVHIRPGVRWVVGALSFSGNEEVESAILFELAGLDPAETAGQPLSFDRVEEARRAILSHYRDRGYLYAFLSEDLRQVPPRGSLGDWSYVQTSTSAALDVRAVCGRAESAGALECPVELVFRLREGPEVRTGEILVRGAEVTRQAVIRQELALRAGEVLRERDLLETRDNLLRAGVFDRVVVKPIDEDRAAPVKDVLVELRERKQFTLELGVGASTEEGLRAFAGFSDANLFGTALRFQIQGKVSWFLPPLLVLYDPEVRDDIESFYSGFDGLSRLEYELASGFSYPRIVGLPRGFSGGLDLIALRNYEPAFEENTQKATLIGSYKGYRPELLGGPRPLALQLRLSVERSDIRCNDAIQRPELCSNEIQAARSAGSTAYVGAGPRVSWDLRDDALSPRAGIYFEVESIYSKSLDATNPDLVAVEGRAQAYLPVASALGLAFFFRGGRVLALTEGEVPVNRRLFGGGRSTIRGYQEKTLLPQDLESAGAISPGGSLLLALQSELRIAIYGPLALALFYDIGDLYDSGKFTFSSTYNGVRRTLAQGAGAGVRVDTPIGPLSLDVGVPVNQRDVGNDGPRLHFSVGAF